MQSAVPDIMQFEESGGGEFGEVRAIAGDGDIEPEHAGLADGEVGIADGGAHGGGGFGGDPDGDAAGVGDEHFGFWGRLIVAHVLQGWGLEDAFVFGVDLDAEHGAALDDGAGGVDFVAAGGGGAAGGEADGAAGDGGLGEALFAGDDFEGVEDGEGLEDPGFRGEVGFGGDAFDAVGGAGEGDGAVADDWEGIGEGFGEEGAEGDGGEGGFGGDFGVFAEADGACECAGAAGWDGEVCFGDDGAVFGDGEGAFADAEPVEPALAEVAATGEDIEAIGGALGDDDGVGEVAGGGWAGAPCEVEVAGGEAVEGELAEVWGDPEACGEERRVRGGEQGGFFGSDDWDGGSGAGAEVGSEGEGGDIAEVPCLAEEGFEGGGGGDFFRFEP